MNGYHLGLVGEYITLVRKGGIRMFGHDLQRRSKPVLRMLCTLGLLFLITAAPGRSEEATLATKADAVRALVAERMSVEGPGLALRVSVGDELLIDEGYGLADLAHAVPVTPQTKFRIGSITKNITAAAILKLQEEGKLSVSDSLSSVLPEFPNGDRITMEQLLNHTSGIPSYTNSPEFLATVQLAVSAEELIARFKDLPLEFDPGSKFAYNNSGYFLLGQIVAKLSGKSFETYLEEAFFAPLKMSDTGVHRANEIIKHEAYGYTFTGNGYEKALNWDMSQAGGAGALYSTAADLETWMRAFHAGKVLNQESVRAAWKPNMIGSENTRYGYGWFIDDQRGLARISHGGGLNGFSSHLAYYPSVDLSIVTLHNAMPFAISTGKLSEQIAEMLFGDKMDPVPEYVVDASVTEKVLQEYVGRYDYQSAVMEVTLEEGQLYAQLTGQPRHAIYPMSPTRFFWKVVDAQVEFLQDEQNKTVAAKHTQNGTTFRAARLPDLELVKLTAEVLDRHVGSYQLKGLCVMVVERVDDGLMAKLGNQPSLPIFATSETEFAYKIVPAAIVFGEAKEGKTQALTLEQAGLRFSGKRTSP